MAKPPKKPKIREDLNTLAARIVKEATGQAPKTPDPEASKNPAAVARGQLGGKQGGKVRAAKLSAKKRSAIARKAAKVRLNKQK